MAALEGSSLADLQAQLGPSGTLATLRAGIAQVQVGDYTSSLDAAQPAYDALPSPPSALVDDAQASINSMVADIEQASWVAGAGAVG